MVTPRFGFLACLPGDADLRDFGTGPGPHAAQVAADRLALGEFLERPLLWMNQVHGVDPLVWLQSPVATAADIAFVDARAVAPGSAPAACVVTADCLPVLMAAKDGSAWAAVHAGRRGIEQGILEHAAALFSERGIAPELLTVAIGPAICGTCYEVDQALWESWSTTFPEALTRTRQDTPALDLVAAAKTQLTTVGISSVEASAVCTLEDSGWHSYRRSPHSGRQVGFVVGL